MNIKKKQRNIEIMKEEIRMREQKTEKEKEKKGASNNSYIKLFVEKKSEDEEEKGPIIIRI